MAVKKPAVKKASTASTSKSSKSAVKKPASKSTSKAKSASKKQSQLNLPVDDDDSVSPGNSGNQGTTVIREETVRETVRIQEVRFPLDTFLVLMQEAFQLGHRFGRDISDREFEQHMRTVLRTGSAMSLPIRVQSNGAHYIQQLLTHRELVDYAGPALASPEPSSNGSNG